MLIFLSSTVKQTMFLRQFPQQNPMQYNTFIKICIYNKDSTYRVL